MSKAIHHRGKGSWYSQHKGKHHWVDKGDGKWNADKTIYLGPNNALGVEDHEQGFSLYTRKTLGRWFHVTAPNGKVLKLQQTDVGPHPKTGRKIDIAAVAGEAFGYSPKNFPTDGIFTWALIEEEKQDERRRENKAVSA